MFLSSHSKRFSSVILNCFQLFVCRSLSSCVTAAFKAWVVFSVGLWLSNCFQTCLPFILCSDYAKTTWENPARSCPFPCENSTGRTSPCATQHGGQAALRGTVQKLSSVRKRHSSKSLPCWPGCWVCCLSSSPLPSQHLQLSLCAPPVLPSVAIPTLLFWVERQRGSGGVTGTDRW